eukprot:5164384-Lingulodinium_polyedra.AAC.1
MRGGDARDAIRAHRAALSPRQGMSALRGSPAAQHSSVHHSLGTLLMATIAVVARPLASWIARLGW